MALGFVIAVCAALVITVMVWPDAEAAVVTPDDSPRVERAVVRLRDGASPTIRSMRSRAEKQTDGGPVTAGTEARVVAQFGWGKGANQLGRKRSREGNPEGPMSLTIDRAGNAWVLDQANGRIVRLDDRGKQVGETPLTVQAAQDLTVAKNGNAVVMDRLVDKAVAVLGPDGKQLGEISLKGSDPNKLTGVFTDGDGVYVEKEHGDLTRIGDTSGKADADHTQIPGRPTRDGRSYISAQISDGARGHVAVTEIDRASQEHRFTRDLPFGMPVMMILLLDTDSSGLIYLATVGEHPGATSVDPTQQVVDLLCLDPLDGRPLGRAEVPANTSADETFREMTVLDSGGVMFLYRTETGSELRFIDCR